MKRASDLQTASVPPAMPLLAQLLQSAGAIRDALEGLVPGAQLELNAISAAFLQVQRANLLLSRFPVKAGGRVPDELALPLTDYHAVLAEWDRQLPRLHGWLLAERARLGVRQMHTGSVRTWIETDRQTR